MLHFGFDGALGLRILVGDIWAIINILHSPDSATRISGP